MAMVMVLSVLLMERQLGSSLGLLQVSGAT